MTRASCWCCNGRAGAHSRSAASCRSPRRRIMPTPPGTPIRASCRHGPSVIPLEGRDRSRVRRELPNRRRPEGLATARPGRDRGRPLHRGASDADDGSAGRRARTDWSGPQSAMRRPRVRSIVSICSSGHRARMPCGCPTLPTSRRGPALSMSPLSSTPLPGASSAGVSRARLTPALCSTR